MALRRLHAVLFAPTQAVQEELQREQILIVLPDTATVRDLYGLIMEKFNNIFQLAPPPDLVLRDSHFSLIDVSLHHYRVTDVLPHEVLYALPQRVKDVVPRLLAVHCHASTAPCSEQPAVPAPAPAPHAVPPTSAAAAPEPAAPAGPGHPLPAPAATALQAPAAPLAPASAPAPVTPVPASPRAPPRSPAVRASTLSDIPSEPRPQQKKRKPSPPALQVEALPSPSPDADPALPPSSAVKRKLDKAPLEKFLAKPKPAPSTAKALPVSPSSVKIATQSTAPQRKTATVPKPAKVIEDASVHASQHSIITDLKAAAPSKQSTSELQQQLQSLMANSELWDET